MSEELSGTVSPAQENAQELTFQELIIRRLAGGLALTELCRDLQELSVNYPNVEVRGPERGFNGLTRVEIVNSKGIRVNSLDRKGITADSLNRELLRTAPSIFMPRYCEAKDISMRDSAKGETYVTLEFDRASAEVLLEERK